MPEYRARFRILYTPDEGGYNALEPVTGTTSWGSDHAEARAMITEALESYFVEVFLVPPWRKALPGGPTPGPTASM
ncbi:MULTISPECIES: type II toxin-antitoxin system HicB family antitoxin [Streptomyces]|uniref:Type II toxin-antitoxin system HicB family antitoxin n=3 Tax=Streptomyces TaxID=1883 RepID=A0A3Q9FZ74_STRLT|nr:type II toxin-antitoxin system HicB family antitoxin [Streptomyces luteoverticillatus]AZQ72376.1 type II toxin-antitoxin system HicB family antitoxin [Streptomyces luteoverticillatus]